MPWLKSIRIDVLLGRVDQTENIVKDIVTALSVWQELEALGVTHWPPLLIDLFWICQLSLFCFVQPLMHTSSLPETKTRIPPSGFDG